MIIIIHNVRLIVMINMITVSVIMCMLAVIMLGVIRSISADITLSRAMCDAHHDCAYDAPAYEGHCRVRVRDYGQPAHFESYRQHYHGDQDYCNY